MYICIYIYIDNHTQVNTIRIVRGSWSQLLGAPGGILVLGLGAPGGRGGGLKHIYIHIYIYIV